MFNHMDGVMGAIANEKTAWQENSFFTVNLAWQELPTNHAEVTPTMGMLVISAHILNPFQKLGSLRKWDKGMDINPEDETFYTTQYHEAFLKYLENEYCAKYQPVPVDKPKSVPSCYLVPSVMALASSQFYFHSNDLCCGEEEYLTHYNVVETPPVVSDCAAHLLTTTRLHLNSAWEARNHFGQINPNFNNYHSDSLGISSPFWIRDIADWWHQHDVTHSRYGDLCNVTRNVFTNISPGVGVEASFSLAWDVIGWRQSKTTSKTLCEKVVVWQFARANNGILAGDDPALNTTNTDNDLQIKKEAEDRILHRMAKVRNLLEMSQGS